MSFTPNAKSDTTDSLRIIFTINRLPYLIGKLPDINCAWQVHVRVRKTYDSLGRLTPTLTRQVSVLQEHEINDKSDHDDDENTAERKDVLRDGLGDNPSAPELPCNPKL